jgi:transposase-like protein
VRQKSHSKDLSSEQIVKGIRRATRKRYSAEEKIRIVLDGLRGEQSIAELCRWHQTLKNRILLENYYLPGDLEAHIDRFVDHYNHCRT